MGPFTWFLFVYVLGGVTFIPLLLGLALYLGSKYVPLPGDTAAPPANDPARIQRLEDEKEVLKTATDNLAEKFQRKHESDVAAGYFAVCREYVAGGVNGKPPDKLSPAGEVVATESPSVYQNMYRSIFDRTQKPTIEPNKDAAGKNTKKANNVFYVVLRHGHLMLYEDIQQLEVRYVIALEYHTVDLYGGGEHLPEGELYIKRNAIRLRRKPTAVGDRVSSLPFFLFSESLSEKEDFYFALLKNQEKKEDDGPPEVQLFDPKDMVTLIQKLHSSEEHLQTRWLNAMLGRLFLGVYKTPFLENFIRQKLHKKISRVKKPSFITRLALQKIETGDGAPFITNPRLKDLTVNGDCTVEADFKYTGHCRVEVAATAKIDLGSRFKAREVDLVLAVVCNNLEGHVLVRFKPPPSNRIWFTFEKMPNMEMTVQPVVSSRQITLTIILRAIESRIREVIAESIVLPFWDDFPFFDTAAETYRGGIWKHAATVPQTTEIEDQDPEDEAEAGSGTQTPARVTEFTDERVASMPVLSSSKDSLKSRIKRSATSTTDSSHGAISTGAESPPKIVPRALRSSSFATIADPMITTNHIDAESARRTSGAVHKPDAASAMLKDLTAKSLSASPIHSPAGSPPNEPAMATALRERGSTTSSNASAESFLKGHAQKPSNSSYVSPIPDQSSFPPTPRTASFDTNPSSINDDSKSNKSFASAAKALTGTDRKQAMVQITAAAGAAQRWSWGVLNKNKQQQIPGGADLANPEVRPDVPMGRGHPLPPPGMPLPPPVRGKGSLGGLPSATKRKPLPPPLLPKRPDLPSPALGSPNKPPLPERRKRQSQSNVDDSVDEVFVVEAPLESAPTSPKNEEHHDEFFGHSETPPPGLSQLGNEEYHLPST